MMIYARNVTYVPESGTMEIMFIKEETTKVGAIQDFKQSSYFSTIQSDAFAGRPK